MALDGAQVQRQAGRETMCGTRWCTGVETGRKGESVWHSMVHRCRDGQEGRQCVALAHLGM